ncbi:TlpA disulfide reductase family protein [Spirosoma pollinicola]|uniref:Thioredoxin domain-containing protein n=1 Tax=Spirosoma pollinicola TaxID=2057025 RepID=A0A2K8YWX9_9BACT|nr:TlpA disulfide reductase family protein [Spirosoma pollinicola]AUD02140.1 hypothetical protein CWM47_10090 [Spirosoma pollinicola]
MESNMILKTILTVLICQTLTCICIGQNRGDDPKKHHFVIIGIIDGLENNTKLSLFDYDTQMVIDSALSQGNKFVLQGNFNEPKQLAIATAYPNYRAVGFFWVDRDSVYLTGNVNTFKQAVLKGSKTEDENLQYKALLLPIQHKRDSLAAVKRKLQFKDSTARQGVEDSFVELEKQVQATKVNFIEQYPDSFVSVEFLRLFTLTKELTKPTIQRLYKGLSTKLQRSSIGERIQEYLQHSSNIGLGDHYVDFGQITLGGQPVKLSDFKGKYILLEFWGSGCIPCRAENPELVKLYKQYHPQGLEIVGVSLDTDRERWQKAVEQDQLPWPQVSDLKGAYNRGVLIYNVPGMPSNFLIDSNGKIVGKNLRRDKLRNKLVAIFGQ